MSIDKEKLEKILKDQKAKSMVEILAEFDISATNTDDKIRIDLNEDRYAKLKCVGETWLVIEGPELGMRLSEREVIEYAVTRTKAVAGIMVPSHMRIHSISDDVWMDPVKLDDSTYATSDRLGATRFDRMMVYDDGYIELTMCGHVVRQIWADVIYNETTKMDTEVTSYAKRTFF